MNNSDYKGIYADIAQILGEDTVIKLHRHFRGQQITFPMKLYSNAYVENYILKNHKTKCVGN